MRSENASFQSARAWSGVVVEFLRGAAADGSGQSKVSSRPWLPPRGREAVDAPAVERGADRVERVEVGRAVALRLAVVGEAGAAHLRG